MGTIVLAFAANQFDKIADGATELDAWAEFSGKTFASNMGSATWVTIFTV